ncbi:MULTISPECIES: 50S ribosomal protein L21 [unclassified Spiroplasma]|uniref:50S ribosomal protein L21 n=1 Tax=unclassified Spiroplasma TaxID=2637901 RepID=UPI0035C8A005
MSAIILTGGKQLSVEKEQVIWIEKIVGDAGDVVEFDKVLMIDGNIGRPLVPNAKVVGQIIKQGKEKKIVVFTYKPKKNSKTKYGHRQPYTQVKIIDILLDGAKKVSKVVETKSKAVPTAEISDSNNGSGSDSKTAK